ncbi:MAG: helix-turn-helix domain-containing protein [Nitriliruptoraceae bacterium]|nr:helix-turn-helix domain-containing protein [Nitriliruptoraceae bacterium]
MTNTSNPQRDTLTVRETATRLGIGMNTAYVAIRNGEIPAIRIGRRVLVPRDQLERMIAGEQAAPETTVAETTVAGSPADRATA